MAQVEVDYKRPVMRQPWAAEIYAAMVTYFTNGDADQEGHAESLRDAVYRELDVAIEDSGTATDSPVCAYPVGSGGNPRWDGGGNMVATMSSHDFERGSVMRLTDLPLGFVPNRDIIIIDEFHIVALERSLSERLLQPRALSLGPAGVDDLWSVFFGEPYPAVAHGHLVAFHALAHIGSDGEQPSVIKAVNTADRGLVLTLSLRSDDGASETRRVHLLDIEFDDVRTIDDALLGSRGVNSAVVILSWGLVDCAVSDAYASLPAMAGDTRDQTLAHYLHALMSGPDTEELVRNMCRIFRDHDALKGVNCDESDLEWVAGFGTLAAFAEMNSRATRSFEMEFETDGDVRYLAAAGNAGLPFPMPPAGWPGIVGVEACTANVAGIAAFSNAGTVPGLSLYPAVRAVGAWFQAPTWRGDASDELLEGYWGTSFAAPAAAVMFATGQFALEPVGTANVPPIVLPGCSNATDDP
ncbi:MAG: S8 family serine peptidase [Acidimicrobiia bacterium]